MGTDDSVIEAPRIGGTAHHFPDAHARWCVVCGGEGASLPTECPGRMMTEELREMIASGLADFRRGAWMATLV